ncbi:MAG TPA: zinc ribbon domain-containing protein [Candidatus Acidoferrum sp.]|nr:zinc ribbon domain-containing protein [Candidatus Acidoferrum sp.]
MNTPTLVKCRCRNCNGHLEFEANRDGEVLACPHCGVETQLYIPGRAALPVEHGKVVSKPNKKPRTIIGLAIVLLLVVVSLAMWGLETTGTIAAGGLTLIVALIAVAFGIIWAGLWIIFPVFVYFALNRIERLLQQIELNTRR